MLLTHMNWSKPVLTHLCTPSQSFMLLIDESMNFIQSIISNKSLSVTEKITLENWEVGLSVRI